MGNIHQGEVVVHVDDELSDGQRSYLVGHLKGCDGVEDARFTSGRNHLMLIDYDRDQLHAQDVLGYVRETHMGPNWLDRNATCAQLEVMTVAMDAVIQSITGDLCCHSGM